MIETFFLVNNSPRYVDTGNDHRHRTHKRFSTKIILIDEWIQLRERMSHRVDGCVRAMAGR
jgi:hypothetical protein